MQNYVASSVRTLPSVKELHLVGTHCVFADYTAGEDFHLAPKHLYNMPIKSVCQAQCEIDVLNHQILP